MNTQIKNELENIIVAQMLNNKAGGSAIRRKRIITLCQTNEINVCQAIYDRLALARTRCEMRAGYTEADNITELCDAALEVMSNKSNN